MHRAAPPDSERVAPMEQVGSFLYRALTAADDDELHAIAADVRAMLDDFPAPFLVPLAPA